MNLFFYRRVASVLLIILIFFVNSSYASSNNTKVTQIVNEVIQPLIKKYQIPGMAVAVTIDGRDYFYNYGVADKASKRPITKQTLFEIGSVTKTFAATLAAYLSDEHKISLSSPVTQYMPQLKGSAFDKITLLNLATHTSQLPLFTPDNVKNMPQFLDYLKQWQPESSVGSRRVYSNNGVGLLGIIISRKTGKSYEYLLTEKILKPLHLKHTYFEVPQNELPHYAYGYAEDSVPQRMSKTILLPAASGLKSCSEDLIRYVKANMHEIKLPSRIRQAINTTHSSYYKTPYLTQDLVWEQYPYPVTLKQVSIGNGVTQLTAPATAFNPALPPNKHTFINNTGTAKGFSTYIAFIPEKKIGIVLLANKLYPLNQRVIAGYTILSQLKKISHSR